MAPTYVLDGRRAGGEWVACWSCMICRLAACRGWIGGYWVDGRATGGCTPHLGDAVLMKVAISVCR